MNRVRALQRELNRQGVAASLITSSDNLRYFTGYYHWNSLSPFAAAVIPVDGEPLLLVLRADESLGRLVSRVPIEPYDAGSHGYRATARRCQQALDRAAIRGGVMGIEFGAMTMDRYRTLEGMFPQWTFADLTATIAELRLIKDEEEQLAFRRAAAAVAFALKQIMADLRPGISEIEIKGAMDLAVYAEASRQWPAAMVQSVTNVVSGSKVNRLHDAAAGRRVETGEMVFVMGGAIVDGYWANAARTLFVPGSPPRADARRMLDVAIEAQRAAVERLAPGVPLGEAVRAADKVLADARLADHKTYPMFRGLGLKHSERPSALDVDLIIRPGMCLCTQSYLHHPEFIVGQSDSVLITEIGAEVLSDLSSPQEAP